MYIFSSKTDFDIPYTIIRLVSRVSGWSYSIYCITSIELPSDSDIRRIAVHNVRVLRPTTKIYPVNTCPGRANIRKGGPDETSPHESYPKSITADKVNNNNPVAQNRLPIRLIGICVRNHRVISLFLYASAHEMVTYRDTLSHTLASHTTYTRAHGWISPACSVLFVCVYPIDYEIIRCTHACHNKSDSVC